MKIKFISFWKRWHSWIEATVLMLGLLMFVYGGQTWTTYIWQERFHQLIIGYNGVPMAFPTSILCTGTGVGFMLSALLFMGLSRRMDDLENKNE